jgi:hypothetical protein
MSDIKHIESVKRWQKRNPDKCRAMSYAWREKNKEKYSEYKKAYMKKYQEENRERMRAYSHDWRDRHREQHCRNGQAFYWSRRESEIARGIKKNRVLHVKRRIKVLMHYSGGKMECACCGNKNLEFLCIDHINGGGSLQRNSAKYRYGSLYDYLLRLGLPEGFRVLCHNCNLSLGFYGYCPHQAEKENWTDEQFAEARCKHLERRREMIKLSKEIKKCARS